LFSNASFTGIGLIVGSHRNIHTGINANRRREEFAEKRQK